MKDMEYVLEFILNLGSEMLGSGSALERVNQMMYRICEAYGYHDVSIFTLSSVLMISAKDQDEAYVSRQLSVPASGIHLERLKSLNQLIFTVCEEKPAPQELNRLLIQAYEAKEYPIYLVMLGQMIATGFLCFIFGGHLGDVSASMVIAAGLFILLQILGPTGMNKILQNVIAAWAVGAFSVLSIGIGFASQFFIVVIANIMLVIPGIPMVNAMRNLLCGNEMNAGLQFMKVFLESVALVVGVVISMEMFGGMIKW